MVNKKLLTVLMAATMFFSISATTLADTNTSLGAGTTIHQKGNGASIQGT